jgi:hypothetical protein
MACLVHSLALKPVFSYEMLVNFDQPTQDHIPRRSHSSYYPGICPDRTMKYVLQLGQAICGPIFENNASKKYEQAAASDGFTFTEI